MRAIRYHSYGSPDVLRLEEIAAPIPGDDEVLLTVRSASVNPADWHFMRGAPFLFRVAIGLRKPKDARLGLDVAGRVEAIGQKVTRFKPGDDVFGGCRGAFAESVCVAESTLAMKPHNVTFEQAAAVPIAALTVLQGLRDKARLRPGQRVLINGASGGVGTFAVQIAKAFGAIVTGVCSTRNAEMVRSIGADRVIDYTREDFAKGTKRYDVILDCIGNHSPSALRHVLARGGTCVLVGGSGTVAAILFGAIQALALSRFTSQRFAMFFAKIDNADLETLRALLESGKVVPVIDRRYPLAETAAAIRYVEEGHARGKVVIAM